MAAAAGGGFGGSKKVVEIFYDVVSPYSWLGFEMLFIHYYLSHCRYRHNWSIELCFRPAFLGGIMKETGNQPPAMVPKRGEYMMKDIKRMAKYTTSHCSSPRTSLEVLSEKVANDFSVWNELVQSKKIFFLHWQKKLLLLKMRLSLQQSLNPSA
ncbi:unnamed protein product [Natator depressus]